ncbi:ATP-grasp domain-containing protein [Clostridium cellulovorans]|uniref:ATP-grasp domain-containing protein n=1 Tax=Clostridium cellulovorans (strain ATCC 35296 / DSM 3052 / OCM 3 / 743B) TaxID=573061 RepID=D9SU76_CLOC7|nr:ATP-grasp domain-containing protein [Clostridium cellulovorans]ADL52831.1 protein of unknown function DUF201 [Clostridium cellulovorans 743B]
MTKKNILILNTTPYNKYLKDGDFIINKEKYNIFIISNKKRINELNSKDFKEIFCCEMNEEDKILQISCEINNKNKIDHVIALSEKTVLIAAKIRDHLHIKGMGYNETVPFRDKYVMIEKLNDKGIKVPDFSIITSYEEALNFFNKYKKIIFKPRLGIGSQSVQVIESKESLEKVFEYIGNNIYSYIMEEFIEGTMYCCDTIIQNGNIKLCNVTKYLGSTLDFSSKNSLGFVVEDDIRILDKIERFNEDVIKSLNMKDGVTHHEMFLNENNEIVFCEIACRIGGGNLVEEFEIMYGLNLYECSICLELGEKLPKYKKNSICAGFIMFYYKDGEINEISYGDLLYNKWIKSYEIFAQTGNKALVAKHSTDTAAYFIVTGENSNDVTNKLTSIKNQFNISYVNN